MTLTTPIGSSLWASPTLPCTIGSRIPTAGFVVNCHYSRIRPQDSNVLISKLPSQYYRPNAPTKSMSTSLLTTTTTNTRHWGELSMVRSGSLWATATATISPEESSSSKTSKSTLDGHSTTATTANNTSMTLHDDTTAKVTTTSSSAASSSSDISFIRNMLQRLGTAFATPIPGITPTMAMGYPFMLLAVSHQLVSASYTNTIFLLSMYGSISLFLRMVVLLEGKKVQGLASTSSSESYSTTSSTSLDIAFRMFDLYAAISAIAMTSFYYTFIHHPTILSTVESFVFFLAIANLEHWVVNHPEEAKKQWNKQLNPQEWGEPM